LLGSFLLLTGKPNIHRSGPRVVSTGADYRDMISRPLIQLSSA